jgi:hypothetical protein
MNYTLILTVIASLVVGGAAGAGASHWLFSPPSAAPQACPQDNSWNQFLGAPVQPQAGKTYK